MNEVKDVHHTGAEVGDENTMSGVSRHCVRLLQDVGGGKVFLWASDDIKTSVKDRAQSTFNVMGGGELADKNKVFGSAFLGTLGPRGIGSRRSQNPARHQQRKDENGLPGSHISTSLSIIMD